ncbi:MULTISPECIES: hypothetical protein [unclassified Streptomyces]|uniref:hypothetical protein n=1 Tax=unclassified Streptomyces TaxID=2593676 RepID=UPI0036693A15
MAKDPRGGFVERVPQQHSGKGKLRGIGREHQGRARFREEDGIERLPQPRVRRVRTAQRPGC